jgi:copper transport protein
VKAARATLAGNRARRVALVALGACAAALLGASSALAHAQLTGTSPASGSIVARQPSQVIFKFNQSVGGTLGAVRVYDAQGNEVDDLAVSHPGGHQSWMGVGLKPHLPDGTYTATYRVISADTHIVYGGLVFSVGHPGAAPRYTVAGLIGRNESGEVTKVAFGAARVLDYVSIALLLGGLAFLALAWLPALAAVAGAEPEWQLASHAFARRLQLMLVAAIVLGVLASLLGFLLQGATAAGLSLWASLKAPVLESTLHSRFGWVWGSRAIDWIVLGALLLALRAARRAPVPVLRPVALGADGLALDSAPPRWFLGLVGLAVFYLAFTPALSGHASVQSPVALFLPASVLHVLGASVWVGGIVCLLLALPAATRRLERRHRSRLLLATLTRFSAVALVAVLAVALTGVVQAYIDVRSLEGLLHTIYGQLLIVKTALLTALIGLGWVNRSRVIPALERIADSGASPGRSGMLARRTMRAELLLMLCVLGVTAALITYAPPIDTASGPFSTNTTLGPAELEMTVEPARVGLNTVHLYLINASTGTQFTATKELVAHARLPARDIGPLPLQVSIAGPGHYILSNAELTPGGTWQLELVDRVSEFQEYSRTVKVPIR